MLGSAAHGLGAIEQLSGGLIDLLDIATDLIGGGRLLLGSRGDLRQSVADALHRVDDVLQFITHGQHAADVAVGLAAGFFHQGDRLSNHALQVVHGLGDFLGRVLGAIGQRAHFISDHGEASPSLTRTPSGKH
ncbi:hypothetical protein ACP87_19930 [Pseudomonas oleovorans]|nr:hypothetical protein JF55_06760 [Pseudomonas sp. 1-7]MBN7119918.1 hypothetical protein [Pseudomonas oleovorans]MBN7130990.1 hypothetical protein [Pseudomonas oleovorans]MBN7139770.1 hypothetical protein [Pseudomonas oleovorans]